MRPWALYACLNTVALMTAGAGNAGDGATVENDPDCHIPAQPPHSTIAYTQGPVDMALYHGATTRYPHAALGDDIEATTLMVRKNGPNGKTCDHLRPGKGRVFEDLTPRLVDLTADGSAEVLTITSDPELGSRLEIYGYTHTGARLQLLAKTPFVGQRFRWRAPIGVADLNGDGMPEIVEIDRPHLAKVMRIWTYRKNVLTEIAHLQGISNHRNGLPEIHGGIRHCRGTAPEIIVASGDWTRVYAVQLDGSTLRRSDLGPFKGAHSITANLRCDTRAHAVPWSANHAGGSTLDRQSNSARD